MLFRSGIASILEIPLNTSRGLLLGLAGFACVVVAPALGLPAEPPGVDAGDLQARQLWWLGTAVATGGGIWLLMRTARAWWWGAAATLLIALPHLIGAPASDGAAIVPDELIRRFQVASIATNAVFWLLVGMVGGWLTSRQQRQP